MTISGKGFSVASRYTLEIAHSRVRPDVLNFHGREALSEPYEWRIEFTAPQNDLAPDDVLLKYATLKMLSARVVYGVITRFEWLGTSADQTHYAVTLASRLALLSLTRRCAVYQNLSVPELLEQILRAHGLEGPDFDFRLERSYPQRELITQWRETDLEFIQRILSEVGVWFRTEMNAVTQLETLIVGDSQLNCVFGVSVPYREPSGLYDGAQDAVWDVRCWQNTVTGVVRTRDYNYRTADTPMDSAVTVRSEAITTGEHYRYGAPFLEAGDDATSEPEMESGAFYARIHHERELNSATRLHLFSNASHLTPGQVLETPESPVTALKEGMLITLATYRAARDTRLHVSLWGIPYSERVNYRPVEIIRPEIHGTLPARIEAVSRMTPTPGWTIQAATGRSWISAVKMLSLAITTCGFVRQSRMRVMPLAGTRRFWTAPKSALRLTTAISTALISPMSFTTLNMPTSSRATTAARTFCAQRRTMNCEWRICAGRSTSR